ncbi:MAG: SH3 domain-containing protein [Microvirga sp.]|nr:SH3 domain-containing protein [Microvirga sp.]
MKSATFAGAATTLAAAGLGAVLSLAPTAPAQAATAYVTNDLNMRAGPSTRYGVVRVLPAGSPVELLNCASRASWCEVAFRGVRGWVSGRYLDDGYRRPGRVIPADPGPVFGGPVVTFEFGMSPRYYEPPEYRGDDGWGYRYDPRYVRRPYDPRPYDPRPYDPRPYDPRPYDPFWGGW